MNKYIQDSLRNHARSIISSLTRPQQKAVTEMMRGLFTAGRPILRHMCQSEEKTAKKQGEKYSHHLGNINIIQKVNDLAIRKINSDMRKNTIIAYDLTDIAKTSSKKMEKIKKIFDGSKRKVANGYDLHGVGINGYLMRLETHDDSKYFRNQVRKYIIKEISEKLGKKGIWVLDRGNDDKQFFIDLRQFLKLRFIVRLKKNRTVIMKETGVINKVANISDGTYTVYLLDKHNHKVDTRFEYTLVIKTHLKGKQPIRLISNIPKEKFSSTQFVTMYLERWGVENIFKQVKQHFELEKIRVLSYTKFLNLIALIQFVMIVSTSIFINIQKFTNTLIAGVIMIYRKFIKKKSLGFNFDSFVRFLKNSINTVSYHKPPPKQLSLFSHRNLKKLGSF